MEYSMEFHGTLVPPNEVSLSSMEFHGTLRLSFYDMLSWTSKGYSVEFNGTLESTNKISPSSMGFHGLRRAPFQMTQVFHGIFHGIPWNSGAAKWNMINFHGIPWNFKIVILINTMLPLTSWNIPWNYMELWSRQIRPFRMEYRHLSKMRGTKKLLWNWKISIYSQIPWNFENSIEFHGTSQLVIVIPWNSMEFGYVAKFHGAFKIPWNSMELLF